MLSRLMNYWPLLALVSVAALAGWGICYGIRGDKMAWMQYFMGLLFCQFALVKLFNISGFADGFQMYDLLAKNNRYYALAYPFIELALSFAYLAFLVPQVTYLATLILMAISAVGVAKALRRGLNIHCACMGSVLKVPLSTVTLTENIGMGAMALVMLAQSIA